MEVRIGTEAWATVIGATSYEVSNAGEVRRRVEWNAGKAGYVMSQKLNRGYRQVSLRYDSGRRITRYVHQLVAEAFHGPRPTRQHHCAHINGSRTDNRAENIYWCTPKQNGADKVRHGRSPKGSRNPKAKLNEMQVRDIRRMLANGVSGAVLARTFGVTSTMISYIKSGKSWQHV